LQARTASDELANMNSPSSPPKIGPQVIRRPKQTNLETANQMFKDAFLVKKSRFAVENPQLSEQEIYKMTADYFRNLPDNDGKRGQI
jgi:hypothetical protein